MRDAILVLIGIVIGLGVGYAVFGGTETTATDTGGDDRDIWPMTQCPPEPAPHQGTTAKDKLDEISNMALGVMPPTPDSQYCLLKSQTVQSIQPPDPNAASGNALTAHAKAQEGKWDECKQALLMIAPD